MKFLTIFILILGIGALFSGLPGAAMEQGSDLMETKPEGYETATLAGGCFWCVESEFRAMNGVLFTRAGYTGGALENPSYEDITTGKTGHAEAVEVTFDPKKISYEELLEFFLTQAHDPTQLNHQGVDKGTQYRSAIFYHSPKQEKIARDMIAKLEKDKRFDDPIVTEIVPAQEFYVAEDYHQQYYEKYEEKTGQPHIRVLLKQAKKWK